MGSAQFSGAGLSAECYVPHAHCSPIAHKDVNFVSHEDVNFVNSSPRDLASEMSTQNARCMVAEPFFCISKRITFRTTYVFLKRATSFFEVTSAFFVSQAFSLAKMNGICMHIFSLRQLWVPEFYDFPYFGQNANGATF